MLYAIRVSVADSDEQAYEEAHATYQIVSGTPDTVIKKLQPIMDLVDPGYLILWDREGPMSHQVAMRAIDLLGQEVIPALKAYQPDRLRDLIWQPGMASPTYKEIARRSECLLDSTNGRYGRGGNRNPVLAEHSRADQTRHC